MRISKLRKPKIITQEWIDKNKKRLVDNLFRILLKVSTIEMKYYEDEEWSGYDLHTYENLLRDHKNFCNQLGELCIIEVNFKQER